MNRVEAQRALEALRNGVPNAAAVRSLGCMQPEVRDRFLWQLDLLAAEPADVNPPFVPGTLIRGDFGTGKSHTLAYLEQEALARRFVVSRLAISKETPLHDPTKVFQAAVRNARLPDARGSLLHELALRMDYRSAGAKSFMDWVTQRQPHGMVAASVLIDEQSRDAELKERMVNWWSGDKLEVKQVRDGLKDLGLSFDRPVKAIKLADLAPVRFEFVARLVRAAGFSGWVLLLDEVELIARYSLLQRARAYAELARWLGVVPDHGVPGITVVAAITDDFSIEMLDRRNDREKVPERLQKKGEQQCVLSFFCPDEPLQPEPIRQATDQQSLTQTLMAKLGMDTIANNSIRLHAPNDDTLAVSRDRLANLYESAYGFRPQIGAEMAGGKHSFMRSYVRRWISEWDLHRLYGDRPQELIEEPPRPPDYSEDPHFESMNQDHQENQENPAGESP